MNKFEQLGLEENLLLAIKDLGFETPSEVQEKAIPILLQQDTDLVALAQTGTGKTAAFGFPMIQKINVDSRTTQGLILSPTRELCLQITNDIKNYGKYYKGLNVTAIYGGASITDQARQVKRGAQIIVATPGRMKDMINRRLVDISKIEYAVLDEADEMLSLGFWPDMREIASHLPENRRTHLFSATIPEKVRSLSRFFQHDAEYMTLEGDQIAPQEIEHFYYVCTASNKEATLLRIIEYEDPESAIVFCNTKADVRYITNYLTKRKIDADQISGDLNQAAREAALKKIKEGKLRFLIATDVAARGIDISDLSHVISYSTSDSPEVYVHRTGRTGRAGKSGVAISLVSGLDIGNFKHMQNVNKIKIAEREIPSEKQMLGRTRERLEVKVEHEMRSVPAPQLVFKVEKLVPVVEAMAKDPEGRRDLAAICAFYLQEHKPETTVTVDDDSDSSDSTAPEDRPPPRSRGPRGGSSRSGRGKPSGGRSGGDRSGGPRGKRRPRKR